MKAWEKNIRHVIPYVPGEQPDSKDIIKLNTNENPYPPAPNVKKIMEELSADALRLYPNLDSEPLVKELAEFYGRSPNEFFVGVGSDDVLNVAFMTFFNADKPILFPDITYSFYDVWADLYKIPYEQPMLDEQFRIKKEDYCKENGGIVLANPNAPTSIYEDIYNMEEIIKQNQTSVVILDEAYIDFGGESAIKLLDRYENLLIVQTFSKARSMAGMRIGFAVGSPDLIRAMNHVKFCINSYTMSYPAICYGVESVKDKDYFYDTLSKIINTREWVKKELEQIGFTCLDSKTNFLFITHEEIPAKAIYEYLKKHKIYVRYFNKTRINNYLRVTIGKDSQMKILLQILQKYV